MVYALPLERVPSCVSTPGYGFWSFILRYLCPHKNSSFEVSDDILACNLWFGPPPIKNPNYAYAITCEWELASPHRELASPVEIQRPPIEIWALVDQTKKGPFSPNKFHKYRPNLVPNCDEVLFFFLFFTWFEDKNSSIFGENFFFWSSLDFVDEIT